MVKVSLSHWGRHHGKDVVLFSLSGGGVSAAVSNYGAVLQSFLVEDANGKPLDIVLGYDSLGEYLTDRNYFGAMIGPIADRLAQGRCLLSGKAIQMPLNAGPDSMHSGPKGFHSQVWDWEELPDGVLFSRSFPDMSLGFPGELIASIAYRITQPGTLRLEYRASCSMETALSFTNHSYFNLNGMRWDCLDHSLQVFSDSYAETERGQDPLVTGRLLNVQDTPLDFRTAVRVGDAVNRMEYREIAAAGGVDHYFEVSGSGFRDAARLSSPQGGLTLTCRSDADGILVYTGNGLSDAAGKSMVNYGKHWGVCLETGRLPNAVNFPDRRARVLLNPGDEYCSTTEFTIDRPGITGG